MILSVFVRKGNNKINIVTYKNKMDKLYTYHSQNYLSFTIYFYLSSDFLT